MKIVQGQAISGMAASKHRGGSAVYTRLIDGDDTSMIDNFSLILARTPGRYSPRHRHNFEQFRFQLEGTANYGRSGKLKPGMLGYFPEAVHYGPQTQEESEHLAMLVLQFGGASGSGYPGRNATMRAEVELRSFGTFKDGVFHRNPGLPGKRNLDSFQAIWEYLNGRPLVYSKPRYDVPVLVHPDNFDWTPVDDARGVATKALGTFTEYEAGASLIEIEAGARHTLKGPRDLYVVLSGRGSVGPEPAEFLTTLYLQGKDAIEVAASEPLRIVHFRLPDLRPLMARLHETQTAQAAE